MAEPTYYIDFCDNTYWVNTMDGKVIDIDGGCGSRTLKEAEEFLREYLTNKVKHQIKYYDKLGNQMELTYESQNTSKLSPRQSCTCPSCIGI
jgi:hypothetical protein